MEVAVLVERLHTFGSVDGITGVLLPAEPHTNIHTWPEHRFAAIGALICGGTKLEKVKEVLCRELAVECSIWAMVERGDGIV